MEPQRTLLFSRAPWELRAALLEDDVVVEMELEHERAGARPGDVYVGRVRRVMPGLDAAFVDLGQARPSYLPLGRAERATLGPVRKGQPVLVQIARAPLGGKGARLSAHVALPSRSWVLVTRTEGVSISKRIDDAAERDRLKHIGEQLRPAGAGLIARTAAASVAEETLAAEARALIARWETMNEIAATASPPALIHRELDLVHRWLRDRVEEGIARIVVGQADLGDEIRSWLEEHRFGAAVEVELEDDPRGAFEARGVERAISEALRRIVRLPSGGHIAIDRTEALTAIDVDTGRFVGRTDFESTVLHTNLEAAAAIARQVRLRNLGGILVIDFIDMASAVPRERVLAALRELFARDSAPTEVLPFTPLGLVQVTRKRTRPDLAEQLLMTCEGCGGTGRVGADSAVAARALRALAARRGSSTRVALVLRAPPTVVDHLRREEPAAIRALERTLGRSIVLRGDSDLAPESFVVEPPETQPAAPRER